MSWPNVKPGWYVVALLFLYSLLVTLAWQRSEAAAQRTPANGAEPGELVATVAAGEVGGAPYGLWFPVVGARLPENPAYLPGAPRPYRQGVNQGFNFYSEDAGVPIVYGTPVVAAADGVISRADTVYRERTPEEWQALLAAVDEAGADDDQLDLLRGRQLVITTDDGRSLRYAHLSGIRPGIFVGQRVYRGQVVAYVGNTGTTEGVRGGSGGARLHFEIWQRDGTFFGEAMDEATLRLRAASLFVGP
jgi:murein DD-endopeptidase MepM/ murein hydrolase activator NlpD